jgi:hypothetical protein
LIIKGLTEGIIGGSLLQRLELASFLSMLDLDRFSTDSWT